MMHNFNMKNYSDHIAIIGAGIAGLTLGIMLKKNNIPNVIFERSSDVSENGAGISISPNGKRVLEKLEILDELQINSGNSAKSIFYSNLKEITTISTNVLTTSRKCLHDALLNKYIDLGGNIKFNSELKDMNTKQNQICLKNGEFFKVRHIAACDGIKSICHKKESAINSNPKYSGYSVWRVIFESKQNSINFHLGPNFHVVSYPVDSNRVSFVAALKNDNKFKESWKEKGTIDDLLDEVPPRIIDKYKSIKESKNIYRWGVYIRPQIEFLFKENITYLGDAAHPIVPFIGQGGCMALEDAYAFGYLLSKHNNDIEIAQKNYQKLRLKRIRSIHKSSLFQAKLNHLSNPFLVRLRNILMRYTGVISYRTKSIWSYDITAELS
jgi:salicylate hydroxylase